MLEGSVQMEIGETKVKVAAGETGLFFPGIFRFQRFSTTRSSHHFWCSLHENTVGPELAAELRRAQTNIKTTSRLHTLFELGLSLPYGLAEQASGLLVALSHAAMQEYLYACRRTTERTEAMPMRRALEYIGQFSQQNLTLTSIAQGAGISPAQLVRLFRQHFDTTPMRYVWATRTRHGAQLLRETGMSIAEIAYRVGFQTSFHFARWIRAMFGTSPRELRRHSWKGSADLAPGAGGKGETEADVVGLESAGGRS